MTTILHHEIIFYFIFVWPLLFLFSLIILPSRDRNARTVLLLFLTGPFGTLYCLWKPFIYPEKAQLESSMSAPDAHAGGNAKAKMLFLMLIFSWGMLLVMGTGIFLHKGWSQNYYLLIRWHSYVGYVSFCLFSFFLYKHAVRHADRKAGIFLSGALFVLFVLTFTLNEINIRYLLSFPLMFLAASLLFSVSARISKPVREETTRAGSGLFFVMTMAYITGITLAEPVNSYATNNMALYILYIHGAIALLVIPLVFSFMQIHLGKAFPQWFSLARKLALPAYAAALFIFYPYAHHKWSGDRIEWRPVKTTHETEPTLAPVANPKALFHESYARTLNDYTVCDGTRCHPSLVKQWKYSTHRFSAGNVFFQKVVEKFAKENGRETTRFCQNCHDPVGAFQSDRTKYTAAARWKQSRGVTCKVCHSISHVKPLAGNGSYTLREEIPYPVDVTAPGWEEKWQNYIRWDLRLHFKNYSNPPLYQSPDFCVACHRLVLPSSYNGKDGKVVIHDPYEPWKNSAYAKNGLKCRGCHMDELARDERGIFFPDHRFAGFNQALSVMVTDKNVPRGELKKFDSFTESWIQGKIPLHAKVKKGHILGLQMNVSKPHGENNLAVTIKTKNERVGHQFPAGSLDFTEVWLEVKVTDKNNNILYHSGFLNPDFTLDARAHKLGGDMLDKNGKPILFHNVWETARIINLREILPGKTVEDMYHVPLPPDAAFPLSVTAQWNYRRARQTFVDWVFNQHPQDAKKVTFPVTCIVSATVSVSPPFTMSMSPR